MTPLDFAAILARDPETRALAVAIVARGLSDDDPTTLRQGWPLSTAIQAAIRYFGLEGMSDARTIEAEALRIAPTVSDAMLNRSAR